MRFRLPFTPEPTEHEQLRLEVVAAASEAAVVCALVDAELAHCSESPETQQILDDCRRYREDAMDILSATTRLDLMVEEELRATLAVLEVRLDDAREMREAPAAGAPRKSRRVDFRAAPPSGSTRAAVHAAAPPSRWWNATGKGIAPAPLDFQPSSPS